MSNPSKRRILVAKRKYSEISNMDVDDDGAPVQGQVVQGPGAGPFANPPSISFGITPAPTATNRFPLPAVTPTPSNVTAPFAVSGPFSGNPVTTAAGFMSQSEGAMYSQPKKHHASHFSLQPNVSQLNQYISVPDQHGIHRNVPVNPLQLQQVVSVIGTQESGFPVQQPSLGSLPSATSTQSVFSAQSSQASSSNISAASMDLASFLMQQLQTPRTRDEILRCRQMLDETLLHIQQEGERT